MTQNGHLAGLMQTATEVMERRGRDFTEEHSALYRSLFDQTAAERQRVVFETERRRLRRSA